LPKEQWLKAEDDKRYVSPILEEVVKENAEREAWDTVKVKKAGN
jgi:ubiquinol-cytochrome c reductase subunit 7